MSKQSAEKVIMTLVRQTWGKLKDDYPEFRMKWMSTAQRQLTLLETVPMLLNWNYTMITYRDDRPQPVIVIATNIQLSHCSDAVRGSIELPVSDPKFGDNLAAYLMSAATVMRAGEEMGNNLKVTTDEYVADLKTMLTGERAK